MPGGQILMKTFSDKVAAITGAASGIGRALALELSRRGCHLALADRNAEELARTAEQVAASGIKVTTTVLDVSDRAAVFAWAAEAVREHGRVNLLFNNAGVGGATVAETVRIEDFEWLMNINFWGVVHGSQAFLPYLRASGEGALINISSLNGLMAMPTRGAYNASKFAVRGYTEALRMELELEDACVSVTCVHPGGIATNFAQQGRVDADVQRLTGESQELVRRSWGQMLQRTTPERAAVQILAGVSRRARRVLVGSDAWLMDKLVRVLGASYQVLLVRATRRLRARNLARQSRLPAG